MTQKEDHSDAIYSLRDMHEILKSKHGFEEVAADPTNLYFLGRFRHLRHQIEREPERTLTSMTREGDKIIVKQSIGTQNQFAYFCLGIPDDDNEGAIRRSFGESGFKIYCCIRQEFEFKGKTYQYFGESEGLVVDAPITADSWRKVYRALVIDKDTNLLENKPLEDLLFYKGLLATCIDRGWELYVQNSKEIGCTLNLTSQPSNLEITFIIQRVDQDTYRILYGADFFTTAWRVLSGPIEVPLYYFPMTIHSCMYKISAEELRKKGIPAPMAPRNWNHVRNMLIKYYHFRLRPGDSSPNKGFRVPHLELFVNETYDYRKWHKFCIVDMPADIQPVEDGFVVKIFFAQCFVLKDGNIKEYRDNKIFRCDYPQPVDWLKILRHLASMPEYRKFRVLGPPPKDEELAPVPPMENPNGMGSPARTLRPDEVEEDDDRVAARGPPRQTFFENPNPFYHHRD